jgi:predicted nucleotidyltransferase
MRRSSDIDICVYYDDEVDRASMFRLRVLSELFDDTYDIKIFQQMPVYARVEVLKGKALYCDDRRFMYDKAYETIKEFDSFKHIYYDYIGAEPIR